jgi:hypothetical protein
MKMSLQFKVGMVIELKPYRYNKNIRIKEMIEKAVCFRVCRKSCHFIRESGVFFSIDKEFQEKYHPKLIGKFKEDYDFNEDFILERIPPKAKIKD